MTDELKPCKLCGPKSDDDHKPLLMSRRDVRNEYDVEYEVFCQSCGLSVHGECEHEAIDRWNRLNDGLCFAQAQDDDHSPDAAKMVREPAGGLVERVTNALLANMTAMRGQSMASFAEQCARAVLALLQPRLEAAEGLLSAAETARSAALGYVSVKNAVDVLDNAIVAAKAAGLGVRHDHDTN